MSYPLSRSEPKKIVYVEIEPEPEMPAAVIEWNPFYVRPSPAPSTLRRSTAMEDLRIENLKVGQVAHRRFSDSGVQESLLSKY